MRTFKLLLFIVIFSFSNNLSAQDEDYYAFMGASKADILKVNSSQKRIINGEYYELGFSMSYDTNFHYYFDENLLCYRIIIQKGLKDFENSRLILSGDFPNQGEGNGIYFFWNSRMMATLVKMENSIVIAYEKINPELIKSKCYKCKI